MIEMLVPMADQIDGVVVGCFDDTGVDASKPFKRSDSWDLSGLYAGSRCAK